MTAVFDTTSVHDLTEAGRQAACGWALHLLAIENHRLTGQPLHRLSWVIREDQPRLFGTAYANTDEQRTQIVHDWASHLGGTVTVTNPDGRERRIEFDVIAHGVEIHIQARLSAAIKEAAA